MSKPIALAVWGGLYFVAVLTALWMIQNTPIWAAAIAAVVALALSFPFIAVLKRKGVSRG